MFRSIQITFAQNPGEKFTPIYEEQEDLRTVSVNAGDIRLYVGGGGINRAFNSVLINSKQNTYTYSQVHRIGYDKLLEHFSNNRIDYPSNILNVDISNQRSYLKELYVSKHENFYKKDEQGLVFLDFFARKFPYNDPNNFGMVYLVGPNGVEYQSKTKFLKDVRMTANTLASMIASYNENNPENTIQQLRLCLYSGLRYKHRRCSKKEVAKNIILGLCDIEKFTQLNDFKIVFAYDDDVFRKVYEELKN